MAAASPNIIPECSICCENFKAPKFLPCGHTFCYDCVERYIGDRKATFPCPLCGQDITIPDGGAKMFATNFIAQTTTQPDATQQPSLTTSDTTQPSSTTSDTTQPSSTTSDTTQPSSTTSDTTQPSSTTSDTTQHGGTTAKQYCSNHSAREVEYYCINCKTLVCNKCFIIQHNGHEFIDIESETAKEKATELVLNSEKFIKDKIQNLEKTHAALLETSENLKCFGEDSCSRISIQTERIITDIREKSETVQTEIRQNIDQTEIELTETREKVMEQIKNFKVDLETNLPSLTEDSSVQILASLPKIKELEQLCETMKDVNTSEVYGYKDWREKNFSVDTDMLGSVVTKSYYLHKLNHFRFNINDFEDGKTFYYSEDEFTSNDVVWSCFVMKGKNGYLGIYNAVDSSDNPKLEYCRINSKVSLLNINYDYKTRAKTGDNKFSISSPIWGCDQFISWSTFNDKNQGYISSDGQFVVQLDITQVREIKFKEP